METWCCLQREKGPQTECRAEREKENEKESQHEREKKRKPYRLTDPQRLTNRPMGRALTTCSSYTQRERLSWGYTLGPSLCILTHSCFLLGEGIGHVRYSPSWSPVGGGCLQRGACLCALGCQSAQPTLCSCSRAWWESSIWGLEFRGHYCSTLFQTPKSCPPTQLLTVLELFF